MALRLHSRPPARLPAAVAALLLAATAVRAGPLAVLEISGVKAPPAPLPAAVAELELAVGASAMPLAVTGLRRLAPRPGEGPRLLAGLGPGVPRLRVVGDAGSTRALVRAPAGSSLRIRGRLDARTRQFHLLSVWVEPPAGGS